MPQGLKFLTIPLAFTVQGCWALESLGGRCPQEQLTVTWPATITRGSSTNSTLLTYTLLPDKVGQQQFDQLRQALTQNVAATSYNVVWTIPAFDTNGGYISFAHAAPLNEGTASQVTSTFTGGSWSAAPFMPSPWAVAVHADNYTATTATGSITALATTPVRLRIDITTNNAAGEAIRLTGEAGFNYQLVTASCVTP